MSPFPFSLLSGMLKGPTSWSVPEQHYLTFALLALIENNTMWKVAFRFDKGAVDGVKTQGKKLVELHCTISEKLFLSDPSGRWNESLNIIKLGNAIKNRITRYAKYYLSHTGCTNI